MKKIILGLALLVTSTANAATLGCFIEPLGSSCSTSRIACNVENPNINYINFGFTVGELCNAYVSTWYSLQSKQSESQGYYNSYATCSTGLSAAGNALENQRRLVSRLRKACGSKCKKIK